MATGIGGSRSGEFRDIPLAIDDSFSKSVNGSEFDSRFLATCPTEGYRHLAENKKMSRFKQRSISYCSGSRNQFKLPTSSGAQLFVKDINFKKENVSAKRRMGKTSLKKKEKPKDNLEKNTNILSFGWGRLQSEDCREKWQEKARKKRHQFKKDSREIAIFLFRVFRVLAMRECTAKTRISQLALNRRKKEKHSSRPQHSSSRNWKVSLATIFPLIQRNKTKLRKKKLASQ